jgi:hypothetical protein
MEGDLRRITKRYGQTPVVKRLRRENLPASVMAIWGSVELQPVDNESLMRLAKGESFPRGILADQINNYRLSAKNGLQIFNLRGGPGYVWIATVEREGKGSLRFFAIDPSQFRRSEIAAPDLEAAKPSDGTTEVPTLPKPATDRTTVDRPSDREVSTREPLAAGGEAQNTKPATEPRTPSSEAVATVQQDPNDVVAQVLNYTVFGNDNGMGGSFWYRTTTAQCSYALHVPKVGRGDFAALPAIMQLGVRQSVNLEELDPRSILFRIDRQEALWGRGGEGTLTMYDSDILFLSLGRLNIKRLQRGWALICDEYCQGKARPF